MFQDPRRTIRLASLSLILAACRPAASAPPPAASASDPPPAAPASDPAGDHGAAPTQPARLVPADPSASPPLVGALDKEDIRTVVRSRIADVRGCYNRGLARDPRLTGRVTVQFTIGSAGTVMASVVQASTLPTEASAVADCIAAVARHWQFPAPEGGGSVVVSYPFVLEPAEPTTSPSGLVQGTRNVGEWFAVSGFSPGTLVVETVDGARRSATGTTVVLKVFTREREELRRAVTDPRGRAVFTGLPAAGSATATVDGPGAVPSTAVMLGQGAMGTILEVEGEASSAAR